jgi:hypothetical protein
MEERHGVEQVAQWDAERKKPKSDKLMDFPDIRQKYKDKTRKLLEPFGYTSFIFCGRRAAP